MNKVVLMGRLVREPEVRYSKSDSPVAIARYTLAVSRRLKKEGEPEADFINCVAFGKSGEFVEKFFRKGQMVSVVGRLQVRTWDDKDGTKRWSTDVVTEEHYFAESKASFEGRMASHQADEQPYHQQTAPKVAPQQNVPSGDGGFYPIEDGLDDSDLPF